MSKNNNITLGIIGILKAIEDPNTGVPTEFHEIVDYHVNLQYNSVVVNLKSYFSQKHYQAGKQSFGGQNITIHGLPERGQDVLDWIYRQIAAPIADGAVDLYGNPLTPHLLTGGELVSA